MLKRSKRLEDKLCFVQFIHPGGDPQPGRGGFKSWNRSRRHKRKFLKNSGRFLNGGKLEEGEIAFWAEWEPESELISEISPPLPGGPRYVYRPYYVTPTSYERLQNTDPFVFGERFYYTGCQQKSNNRPTQLRHLSRGTVILFGSCINQSDFVVDTVFVVDDWIDHSPGDYKKLLAGAVPQAYKDVTISAWYQEPFGERKSLMLLNSSDSWRLYFGATYENPLNGMFSFFPCLPYESGKRGFARPRIHIRGVVTDNLPQGMKLNPQESLHNVKSLWEEVVEQVGEQGLMLGVFTDMPPKTSYKL